MGRERKRKRTPPAAASATSALALEEQGCGVGSGVGLEAHVEVDSPLDSSIDSGWDRLFTGFHHWRVSGAALKRTSGAAWRSKESASRRAAVSVSVPMEDVKAIMAVLKGSSRAGHARGCDALARLTELFESPRESRSGKTSLSLPLPLLDRVRGLLTLVGRDADRDVSGGGGVGAGAAGATSSAATAKVLALKLLRLSFSDGTVTLAREERKRLDGAMTKSQGSSALRIDGYVAQVAQRELGQAGLRFSDSGKALDPTFFFAGDWSASRVDGHGARFRRFYRHVTTHASILQSIVASVGGKVYLIDESYSSMVCPFTCAKSRCVTRADMVQLQKEAAARAEAEGRAPPHAPTSDDSGLACYARALYKASADDRARYLEQARQDLGGKAWREHPKVKLRKLSLVHQRAIRIAAADAEKKRAASYHGLKIIDGDAEILCPPDAPCQRRLELGLAFDPFRPGDLRHRTRADGSFAPIIYNRDHAPIYNLRLKFSCLGKKDQLHDSRAPRDERIKRAINKRKQTLGPRRTISDVFRSKVHSPSNHIATPHGGSASFSSCGPVSYS